ncbi:hypothetical protein [Flammeovirga aprica]|uniref:DUF983 domain-containing protein n=1 Tax=Flammeovirga aprica JL-4 TaxID=694437 RepID=A0A7X9XBM7_9BACT|nr:hypothetical protein [Flammeovirga aprica]NME70828.1 hypothetical protein [Flammeovirga aprica JL-4]
MSQKRKGFHKSKNVVTCNKFKWQHIFLYGLRLEKSKCPVCKKKNLPEYSDKEKMFIDLGFGFIFATLFVTLPSLLDLVGIQIGNLLSALVTIGIVLLLREIYSSLWPKKIH